MRTVYGTAKSGLLEMEQFVNVLNNKPDDNELYANYNMPEDGVNYFERLLPFWDFTDEARECHILKTK